MRGHRGYNICPWLKNGKRETCGKSCREEYCKVHRLKIRNGSRIPRPCLGCGIGVRSQIQLCRGCGREAERKRLVRTRVKQPPLYNSEWMVTIPFVPFSSPTTPCPPGSPCLTSPPAEESAPAKESDCCRTWHGGEPSWKSGRPKDSMINDEYCFGLRD